MPLKRQHILRKVDTARRKREGNKGKLRPGEKEQENTQSRLAKN